jgi:hypothetical protein
VSLPYTTPVGGTRAPTPKPGPSQGPAPIHAWRQPVGGVREDPTAPKR